jgi:hypothetical protein
MTRRVLFLIVDTFLIGATQNIEFQTAPEGLPEVVPHPGLQHRFLWTNMRTDTFFVQGIPGRFRIRAPFLAEHEHFDFLLPPSPLYKPTPLSIPTPDLSIPTPE